jgi:hypothetical protein
VRNRAVVVGSVYRWNLGLLRARLLFAATVNVPVHVNWLPKIAASEMADPPQFDDPLTYVAVAGVLGNVSDLSPVAWSEIR